jgi:peptidyl-prolyl cis-trans isomerase C
MRRARWALGSQRAVAHTVRCLLLAVMSARTNAFVSTHGGPLTRDARWVCHSCCSKPPSSSLLCPAPSAIALQLAGVASLRRRNRAGIAGCCRMSTRMASANHILVDSESHCLQLKAEIESFIARRAPGAPKLVVDLLGKFSQLARDHSTCPSGVESGGALGEFEEGKMNSAFNDVVFNTGRVGKIEGPIKTDFGYHLILIIKRGDETLQAALTLQGNAAVTHAENAAPLPPAVREYQAREAFNRGKKADPNQPTGKPFNWKEHQQKLKEQEAAAEAAVAAAAAAASAATPAAASAHEFDSQEATGTGDETLQAALTLEGNAAVTHAENAAPLPPAVREYQAREAFNRGKKADPNQPTGKPFNWKEHQQKLKEQEAAAEAAVAAAAAAASAATPAAASAHEFDSQEATGTPPAAAGEVGIVTEVKHKYTARYPDEHSLARGELITVLPALVEPGWYMAVKGGVRGLVPSTHIDTDTTEWELAKRDS